MKVYERELIEGLPKEKADKLIRIVNGINRICGLHKFEEETK
jgi:hypothetical protein